LDVRSYGARGDGASVDTQAIQRTIDACHAVGGGRVLLTAGTYLSETLYLRDGVTLHLARDACLVGHKDPAAYAGFTSADAPQGRWNHALIVGENLQDITITGTGLIDGNRVFDPQGEAGMRGPHTVMLFNCRNVALRDVTIRDSANYAFLFYACTQVRVENATFEGGWDGVHFRGVDFKDGAARWNRDVRIRACRFYTGDDCIAGHYIEDARVEDCILNSSCNGVRLIGPAKNLSFARCEFFGPGRFEHRTPQKLDRTNMLAGLIIQPSAWTPTPGPLEDLCVSDVTMRNVACALHVSIREGNTGARLMFQRLRATEVYSPAISVESWTDEALDEVTLQDIDVTYTPDAFSDARLEGKPQVQEPVQRPGVGVWARPLPAWGFYGRHVGTLNLERVRFRTEDARDDRPVVILDQVAQCRLAHLSHSPVPPGSEVVQCIGSGTLVRENTKAAPLAPHAPSLNGYSRAQAASHDVERFGLHETTFQASGRYNNPFTDLEAEAIVTCPDGSQKTLPLFWNGGKNWTLRISPDAIGPWAYAVTSRDAGLHGKQGSFTCIASPRRGSIRAMAGYGHHFATRDGQPFLFWGDTAWALYLDQPEEKLDRKAVFRYIDRRAREGVNVIHSMLLSEAGWGNSGGAPFHDMQAQRLNPAYWQEVDLRLRYLNDKGIVGGLVLAWGDKQKREPYAWRLFPSVEARKRYTRYIAARYGAYDVYFIVAGEWNAEANTRANTTREAVKAEFVELGDTLAAADAHRRMIGIHPMTADGSVREFNEAAWMSFGDYQQNYRDVHGRLLESRRFGKPLVNSEYGYFLRDASGDGKVDKHNSFTPEDMRYTTWDILMAGAYPVTGYGTTYMGGYRDPGPFNPDDPRNDIWARQYHLAQRFLAGLDWWKLRPMDQALRCAQPRSEDRQIEVRMSPTRTRKVRRPPVRTYWALAEPGRHYVVYARGVTKDISLQLGADAGGEYRARLTNPCTGVMKPIGNRHALAEEFTWTPPDDGDWVLHLATTQAESHTREPPPSMR
jgi:hypothetical protein